MKPDCPIILREATLLDGSGQTSHCVDMLMQAGRIVEIGSSLQTSADVREIPMDGVCVSPGWMDLHTHVFEDYGLFSLSPGQIGLHCGVTTLVDAGSAGALNYALFERNVVRTARETVLAYVNVASPGLLHGHAGVQGFVGDHAHPGFYSEALAKSLLDSYAASIVGWKVRLTAVLADHSREREWQALETLLRLRDATGLPVMVHHIESNVTSDELLGLLKQGDVYTHLYHGRGSSLFKDQEGKPSSAALQARERGVIFDVGHGSGAFSWECAKKACQEADFWPDTISSDLHGYNLFHPVRDLAATMSKFLWLGMPLEQVIAAVTGHVSDAIARRNGKGWIEPGESADLTLFEIEQGDYEMTDSQGEVRHGRERILPLATFHKGELRPCYGYFNRKTSNDAFSRALQKAMSF